MLLSDWNDILPAVLEELLPFHRQLVEFIANLPGKRTTGYSHALRIWNLSKDELDHELQAAFSSIRNALARRGVHRFDDLDIF
jgi:hypothetical protein